MKRLRYHKKSGMLCALASSVLICLSVTLCLAFATSMAAGVSSGDSIDDALFEILGCETGYTYDYTVVDPSWTHFGGYQFDLGTWRAVGGEGYPHEAPPEEQDYRARILYLERGRKPWPHC